MSRISQDLAGQIAFKLTEKSRVSTEKLHLAFREAATLLYEEQTPKEIKEAFKKHSAWIQTRSCVVFEGHGFTWTRLSTTRPVIQNTSGEAKLTLNSKSADKLTTASRKWEKAKKDYEDLKSQTKTALLTLKSYSNIKKEIPLAAPMLPPPMSNALVCSFDDLNKKLQKQPEDKNELTVS